MSEDVMPQQKAIDMHLAYTSPAVVSALAAALRDAREASGRDPATGAVLSPERTGNWLGALGYIALTDQIGTSFRPPGSGRGPGGFEVALADFTPLPGPEIRALYALRNAFAHDFALVNQNAKHADLQHHFSVHAADSGPVVELPTTPWDGDLANRKIGNRTTVNLRLFGDHVEGAVHNLVGLAQAGTLEIALAGGSDELVRRYWMSVSA